MEANNELISESDYDQLVEDSLQQIEEALDDALNDKDADIDYENSGGILTITCEDGSSIIFTRQSAQRELWMAAKSGGFHYRYDPDSRCWISTRSNAPLLEELQRALLAQSGQVLKLDF